MIDKIFKSNTFVTKSILVENNVNSNNNYELTKLEINEIENEIYNTINIKVEIFSTLIKRNEKNVILQGEIVDFRVKFMFILNENNGVYIRILEAIKLDDLLLFNACDKYLVTLHGIDIVYNLDSLSWGSVMFIPFVIFTSSTSSAIYFILFIRSLFTNEIIIPLSSLMLPLEHIIPSRNPSK